MIVFEISKLKRNPKVISSYLKTTGSITNTKADLQVLFPERYIESKMAIIDNTVKTVGIYAIVDSKGNYAVSNVPIMQELSPVSIDDGVVNEERYKILNFAKDSVFIPNTKMIVSTDTIFPTFNDLFSGGRVPWFLTYEDLSEIFVESKKYVGNGIGSAILAFEIIASISARDAGTPTKYYRLTPMKNKPKYVGLNDLFYSYNNTGAKLVGSYLKTGIMTSIVDPETKTSETSNILRK